MADPPSIAQRGWSFNCLLLFVIIALATALRVSHLTKFPLWADELSSLLMANGRAPGDIYIPVDTITPTTADFTAPSTALPISKIHSALATDTHPPFYFFLLRFWRDLFGTQDAAARSFSLLASVAGIFYLYDSVRLLHQNRAAGAWAALIMALATPQIIFAQEVRSYALLTLLLLMAINSIVRVERRGYSRPRWMMLMVSVYVAATTHYLAIPAAMALGAYVLLRFSGTCRWRLFSALCVAGVLFLITSGSLFWSQRANFSTNLQWLSDPSPGFALRMLQRLAVLPVQFFIAPRSTDISNTIGWLGAAFYALPLMALWQRDLLIWVLFAGGIVATAAISDLSQHRASLMHLRFTIAAAPAAYAIIAAIGSQWKSGWMKHLIPAVIALCCVVSLPEAYNQPWKSDYRGYARLFDRVAGPSDLVIFPFESRAKSWEEAIMVTGLMRYSQYSARPVLPLSQPVLPALRDQIGQYPQAWFMNFAPRPSVDQFIPGAQLSRSDWIPGAGSFWKLEISPLPATAPGSAPSPLP